MATITSIATSFSKSLHGFQSHQSCLKCYILIHARVLFPWHCPHGLQGDHVVIQTKSKFTNWSQGGTMQLHWSNLRKTYNTKTLLFKFHSIQLWTSYLDIICCLLLTNLSSTIYYHYQLKWRISYDVSKKHIFTSLWFMQQLSFYILQDHNPQTKFSDHADVQITLTENPPLPLKVKTRVMNFVIYVTKL